MTRLLLNVAVLALLAVAVPACSSDDATGPEILQLAPSSAAPGATIDIQGERFCGGTGVDANGGCIVEPAASVHIGSNATIVRGDTLRWDDERITVVLPGDVAVGATVVTVAVEGVVSAPVDFAVVP